MPSPSIVAAVSIVLGAAPALAQQEDAPPRSSEVAEEMPEQGRSTEVFFAFDKSDIRPSAEPRLEQLARWAARHDGTIVLEGHCDPRGTAPYNVGLSARRAEAVRDRLVELGVNEERVVLAMYGEDGAPRPSYAQERRVTATLTSRPLYEIVDESLAENATALMWSEPVSIAELEGPEHPAVAIR